MKPHIGLTVNQMSASLHCQFSSPTVHHKNGSTYPPINTRGTGQIKIMQAGTNPLPVFCCCGLITSAIFIICGQMGKLKPINGQLTYISVGYCPLYTVTIVFFKKIAIPCVFFIYFCLFKKTLQFYNK